MEKVSATLLLYHGDERHDIACHEIRPNLNFKASIEFKLPQGVSFPDQAVIQPNMELFDKYQPLSGTLVSLTLKIPHLTKKGEEIYRDGFWTGLITMTSTEKPSGACCQSKVDGDTTKLQLNFRMGSAPASYFQNYRDKVKYQMDISLMWLDPSNQYIQVECSSQFAFYRDKNRQSRSTQKKLGLSDLEPKHQDLKTKRRQKNKRVANNDGRQEVDNSNLEHALESIQTEGHLVPSEHLHLSDNISAEYWNNCQTNEEMTVRDAALVSEDQRDEIFRVPSYSQLDLSLNSGYFVDDNIHNDFPWSLLFDDQNCSG